MSFSFPSQAGQLSPELSALVPMVVEQTSRGERSYDIYSRLRKSIVNSYSDVRHFIWSTIIVQYHSTVARLFS